MSSVATSAATWTSILDDDPREIHNVASTHPELVRELATALAAWKDSVGPSR